MPTFADLEAMQATPEPTYPEYADVLAEARRRSRLSNPATLLDEQTAIHSHPHDWCTAVLGYPAPPNPLRLPTVEWHMLVVAHERGLDPLLPPRILAWREEDTARAAETEAGRQAYQARVQERSDRALAACPVPVEKRPNPNSQQVRGGRRSQIVHAIPTVNAVSGKRRRHLAGRALCETASRARRLALGEPCDDPVTCVSCLAYAPKIRAEG
jgi:hypothetical protein